jgi:hypothetical protein
VQIHTDQTLTHIQNARVRHKQTLAQKEKITRPRAQPIKTAIRRQRESAPTSVYKTVADSHTTQQHKLYDTQETHLQALLRQTQNNSSLTSSRTRTTKDKNTATYNNACTQIQKDWCTHIRRSDVNMRARTRTHTHAIKICNTDGAMYRHKILHGLCQRLFHQILLFQLPTLNLRCHESGLNVHNLHTR